MLYAVLCYNNEDEVFGWTREQDAAVMARLGAVHQRHAAKFGPSARLLPTTAATTLRKAPGEQIVLDGPFAETKEQLLGFYVLDCADLDEALALVRELGEANPGGAYEIRPVHFFRPGEAGA